MFAKMKNQFKLSLDLKVDSPLCIKSGDKGIDPSNVDDVCVKSYKNGEEVVFIPGSSIKGVIRTQCEKIINIIAGDKKCCDILQDTNLCNKEEYDKKSATEVYHSICPACKMFGNTKLGGRIKFNDAYPIDNNFKLGYRDGIGINRITGAAHKGAKYDYEVVEDASFKVIITGDNYELYQLKLLLYALNDVNEGYVTFGSNGTRGNGKMLVENLSLTIRDYRKNINCINGYEDNDRGKEVKYSHIGYYNEYKIEEYEKVLELFENINIENNIKN